LVRNYALAWWLADQRIDLCDYGESGCVVRTTEARDFVLVFGLSVALVVMVGAAFVWMRRGGSISLNWPRVGRIPAVEDAKPRATSKGRGLAFTIAKASIPFVLVLAALFVFALNRKPAPEPALVADTLDELSMPVDGNPFADLVPAQPDPSTIEDNFDVAADRLESMAEATASQVENDTLPTQRAPESARLPNRVYRIGTGAAPNGQPTPKLEGPEYTMNVDETMVADD
jgi:hypothetical protein